MWLCTGIIKNAPILMLSHTNELKMLSHTNELKMLSHTNELKILYIQVY